MHVEIRELGPEDAQAVGEAAFLLDSEPDAEATRLFLTDPRHHLLIAYDGRGRPIGFVSGVELTHPDKGSELFLYELGVDASARRRDIGRALVEFLRVLARRRGAQPCEPMRVSERAMPSISRLDSERRSVLDTQ